MKKQIEVRYEKQYHYGFSVTKEAARDGSRYFLRTKAQITGRAEAKWSKWEPSTKSEFDSMKFQSHSANVRLPREAA